MFDLDDTAGCSCEQIIEMTGLGNGHTKFGCSNSAMMDWIAFIAGVDYDGGDDQGQNPGIPERSIDSENGSTRYVDLMGTVTSGGETNPTDQKPSAGDRLAGRNN